MAAAAAVKRQSADVAASPTPSSHRVKSENVSANRNRHRPKARASPSPLSLALPAIKFEATGTTSSSITDSPKLQSDTHSPSSTPTMLSPPSPHASQAGSLDSTSLPSSSSPQKPTIADDGSHVPVPHRLTQIATSLPPTGKRKKRASKTTDDFKPQIVDHLPRADDEALSGFSRLKENWYANKWIGKSKGHEQGLVCECDFRQGRDDIAKACTDEAGCINRLTQVECISDDCRCGSFCQNQRFQRKEYAAVEVVKTEKKGYGLRAAERIPAESFVYEYIGEVVEEADFRKRMQRYHDERIPHFYFMMLQRDEYLDATKRGDIARFINHSCNPNCYVAKWHVGKRMRMGIFSQRDIFKGEELTFNYNVDRYGNEAQPCHCGEPNCVGQLGGKIQTDIGGMRNLYIEALGIVDEVERLQARGSRKQKSRILDEDFTPTLHAMEEDEVPTVATAVRQAASNRSILTKLLSRIDVTSDVAVQKRFVRLHGFVLMAGVLTEWKDDKEVLLLVMRILAKWPLIARNKVVDTGVEEIVQGMGKSEDGDISSLATGLYDAWQQLSLEFRIARKEGGDEGEEATELADRSEQTDSLGRQNARRRLRDAEEDNSAIQERMNYALDHAQAPNDVSATLNKVVPRPLGKTAAVSPSAPTPFIGANRFSRNAPWAGGWSRLPAVGRPALGGTPSTPQTPDEHPSASSYGLGANTPPTNPKSLYPALSLEEIIRRANEAQEAERKKAEEEVTALAAAKAEKKRKLVSSSLSKGKNRDLSSSCKDRSSSTSSSLLRKRKSQTSSSSSSSLHANREHHGGEEKGIRASRQERSDRYGGGSGSGEERLLNKKLHLLVSEVVIKVLSPHRDESSGLSSRETFKRHARELTDLVCDKERKNPKFWPPKDGKLDKLSSEKRDKIRTFAEGYVRKLVEKRRAASKASVAEGSTPTCSSQPSAATVAPTNNSS